MPKHKAIKALKDKTENLEGNIKLALIFVAVVVLWMLTGLFKTEEQAEKKAATKSLKTAEVMVIEPENYTRFIEITGTSEPKQIVNLAARTESQVEKIIKDRGERVQKGDILLTLDKEQRIQTLEAAKLDLKRAQTLYKAASNLNKQGYRADTSLETRHAELALAKEALERAQNDLSYTEIKSPIDGIVEDRAVEVGDYAKRGDNLYTLVSTGVYKIVTHISQKDIGSVSLNETAYATLSNGQEVSGTITFIATHAHPVTRTYKVEVEVQSQNLLPTNMSAKVLLPARTTKAYLLPYAAMVLNDKGNLGAMVLDSSNTTHFIEINPLDDNGSGVYITGLKRNKIEVVVKGQASLIEGEKINKVLVQKASNINKVF